MRCITSIQPDMLRACLLSRAGAPGQCGSGSETPSGVVGWWGSNGTDITRLEECRTRDFRPGLTLSVYRTPVNPRWPDEVREKDTGR